MIAKMFSKTKNLDKISNGYFKQYGNIVKALNEYVARKEDIQYKHGTRLFGDVNKVVQTQINDGLNDLKGNFTKMFEDEFQHLKNNENQSLVKWLKNKDNYPIPKFATEEFVEDNYDFINEHFNLKIIDIENIEENDVIVEVRRCQKIRKKYFNQKAILDKMGNTKNKSLLQKCHEKSLDVLKEKENYAKGFLVEFNNFIHQHLVFKTYDFEIDFANPNFNDETLEEALVFFNLVLNLIEHKKIGLHQPHKVFAEKSRFDEFNFDQEYWFPILKQFGLVVI